MFAYIDELSAASVAGHTDELSTSGRVRERYRERLSQHLLAGAGDDVLADAAERAGWTPPTTLTAVLVPSAQLRRVLASLDAETLVVGEDLPDVDGRRRPSALAAPGPRCGRGGRRHLLRVLAGRQAVLGPARPWSRARASYDRAARTAALVPSQDGPIDSEDHLAQLVVRADPDALADLRARVLAPLDDLRPASRERLEETLRSWLLHQGRRDAVAAELHVHAQTVRYRMGELRELYGDRLDDPATVLDLLLALSGGASGGSSPA